MQSSRKSLRHLLALGLLFVRPAGALTLSYDECVKRASEQNPDIAVAIAGVRDNEALVLGAWSGFLPQVTLNAGVTENSSNGSPASSLGNGAVTTSPGTNQTQYTESAQATMSLFNGFSDEGKIRQARANLDAAKANLAIVKATVSANLKTAFAELLFEQQSIDLNDGILKRQQKNLRMVTLRYEGGNENRGNQLYQSASVTQAQYQLDHSRRQVRNGARQLAVLMGEPDLRDLRVSGALIANLPAVPPDYYKVVQDNPTHLQTAALKVAADASVEINNGAWYPNLNLAGSIGRVGTEFPVPGNDRWSVGLNLSFPIFPGTSTIAGVEGAHALQRQAEFALTSADIKLIAGLESAFAGFEDAIGQLKVADDFAKGAQARSVIADGKYATGLMTFEEWTVIDQDFVTRQQNLLMNKRNAMQAEATWEQAEGVGAIK